MERKWLSSSSFWNISIYGTLILDIVICAMVTEYKLELCYGQDSSTCEI